MAETTIVVVDERLERWKDFAFRMVNLNEENGEPSRAWILDKVEKVLWDVEQHIGDGRFITDWDGSKGGLCVGDLDAEYKNDYMPSFRWDSEKREERDEDEEFRLEEEWDDKWRSPVSCAIRAGVDLVYEPSGGVVGYTVGDLRQMYPEGIPAWITEQYPEADWATVSDDTAIWL